jgi:hypothetical protein
MRLVQSCVCPPDRVVAREPVAIAGELGAGRTVVMKELVRRLSGGTDRISLFTLIPRWEAEKASDFSYAEQLNKKGFSEATAGVVQTIFLRAADGPWSAARIGELSSVDTVIHLSRDMAQGRSIPASTPAPLVPGYSRRKRRVMSTS